MHLSAEKHTYAPERESLLDRACTVYASQLASTRTKELPINKSADTSTSCHKVLDMGWALKVVKGAKRFTSKQPQYLRCKFEEGEAGVKQDPEDVCRNMRRAKNKDGTKLFSAEEFLNAQHII